MKKIAFFQSDLQVGGIQRSIVNLLKNLSPLEYDIDLYLFKTDNFYRTEFGENIHIHYLKPFPYYNRLMPFGMVRSLMKLKGIKSTQYDAAIDFNSYWNECAVGALSVNAKKRIMWIHSDLKIRYSENKNFRTMWRFAKNKVNYFDEFAAVSFGITDPFKELTGTDKKISVIPNIVDTKDIFAKSKEQIDFEPDADFFNVVSVGRLYRPKGFDILINHMAEIVKQRPNVRLYILGDGPDKVVLEELIAAKMLSNHVFLLGNKDNPYPYMRKMDAFALTSRYEGQGIVIREAQALGLPIFISKNLEKYNTGIPGTEDMVSAIVNAKKTIKEFNDLKEYNDDIIAAFRKITE